MPGEMEEMLKEKEAVKSEILKEKERGGTGLLCSLLVCLIVSQACYLNYVTLLPVYMAANRSVFNFF